MRLMLCSWLACTLLAVCGVWCAAPAAAQDAAAAPAAGENAAETDTAKPEESPLAAEPETPPDIFEAAVLMADIARPRLARGYLNQLLKQTTADPAILLALRDRFGAAPLLRFLQIPECRPVAVKLLDQLNAAAAAATNDPAHLARLVEQLSGSAEDQSLAFGELKAIGPRVIPPLLGAAADPKKSAQHELILAVLVGMGETAIPALIGAIDAPNDDVSANAMLALGRIRSPRVVPFLWYRAVAPSISPAVRVAAQEALARLLKVSIVEVNRVGSETAVSRLVQAATGFYRLDYPWAPDDDGKVSVWSYHATGGLVETRVAPEVAADRLGLRLASQALQLAPETPAVQALFLGLALTADVQRPGSTNPVATGPGSAFDVALTVGSDLVAEVLSSALSAGRVPTAVAALKVLEQTGTPALLAAGAKPSPLIAALNYPDPRVQFAAAAVVLQLDPPVSFPFAGRVVAILRRALSSQQDAHAIIADPSSEKAGQIGGLLSELAYNPILVTTGRDVFRVAAERTDVELIVLDPNIIRWALTETLANLRGDVRTANIPVVILGGADLRAKMQQHLKNHPRATFAINVNQARDLDLQIRPFLQRITTPPMSADERSTQRAAALGWLVHIAEGRRSKVFPLAGVEDSVGSVLRDPDLGASAITVLGEIPTRSSQKQLADLLLTRDADARLREAAALALAFHIQRFNLLIDKRAIAELHAIDAATTDAGLQTAIGGVLGTLKPDAALIGRRLRQVPRTGAGGE